MKANTLVCVETFKVGVRDRVSEQFAVELMMRRNDLSVASN